MEIPITEKIADTTKMEVTLAVPVITPPAPYISDKGTWMVYDNSTHSYTDTEITAVGKDADITAAEAAIAAANTAAENANNAAAAIDDRATALETGKADLDSEKNYIVPSQLDPLQNMLTGTATANGYFKSTDERLLFAGDRTISILFTLPERVPYNDNVYLFTDQIIRQGRSFYVSVGGTLFANASLGNGINLGRCTDLGFNSTHFLVLSEKNQVAKVWFDGVYRGEIAPVTYYRPTCLCLGNGNAANAINWGGIIHHTRLFNYALSESEVLALWNNGNPKDYQLDNYLKTAALSPVPFVLKGTPCNMDCRYDTETDSIIVHNETSTHESLWAYFGLSIPAVYTEEKNIGFFKIRIKYDAMLDATFTIGFGNGSADYHEPSQIITFPQGNDLIKEIYIPRRNNNLLRYGLNKCLTFFLYKNRNALENLEFKLKAASIQKAGCVAEYLPHGLLTDRWRDSAGQGIDLPVLDTPELSYGNVPALNSVVIDTGIFYTDITSGTASKSMTVPAGYAVDKVVVRSLNEGNLTGITVMNGYSNRSYMKNASVVPTGGRDTIVSAGISIEENTLSGIYPQVYISSKTTPVTVNATGNSTSGGMQVKLICKWIG